MSLQEIIKNMEENNTQHDELLKYTRGYAFDSLVYRFKDYQARAFQSEVNDLKLRKNLIEIEAKDRIKRSHERDLMRFIEILDDVIEEHI